jgi:hypothetical protein
MPKKRFSPYSQIPLKNLTDSISYHVNTNDMVTRLALNKKNIYIYKIKKIIIKIK